MSDVMDYIARLANVALVGTVTHRDTSTGRVRIRLGDGAESDWLPVGQRRSGSARSASVPSIGEQVVALCAGGDPRRGIIVASLPQQAQPLPALAGEEAERIEYSDGAAVEYDPGTHTLRATLPSGATVELAGAGSVTIDAESITLRGEVTVDGSLTATGNVADATRSMAADRQLYNAHRHLETGGTTDGPQPTQ